MHNYPKPAYHHRALKVKILKCRRFLSISRRLILNFFCKGKMRAPSGLFLNMIDENSFRFIILEFMNLLCLADLSRCFVRRPRNLLWLRQDLCLGNRQGCPQGNFSSMLKTKVFDSQSVTNSFNNTVHHKMQRKHEDLNETPKFKIENYFDIFDLALLGRTSGWRLQLPAFPVRNRRSERKCRHEDQDLVRGRP